MHAGAVLATNDSCCASCISLSRCCQPHLCGAVQVCDRHCQRAHQATASHDGQLDVHAVVALQARSTMVMSQTAKTTSRRACNA